MSIQVKKVTKLYGQQRALDDVSFEINTGEIVGFIGPNGAGKSTMMKIITGFIPQTEGEVYINGINTMENSLEIRRMVGYLPENNPLYKDMYVREYLEMVARIYQGSEKAGRQEGRKAKGKGEGREQKAEGKSKDRGAKEEGLSVSKFLGLSVDRMIELVGLTKEQHKKIGALSKGYRQRVGLAQALIHDPEILILDEPTSGLDPNQIVEIRNFIAELGREKTVLLSTHIMQEVEAICHRVLIIHNGRIVANVNMKDQKGSLEKMFQELTMSGDV